MASASMVERTSRLANDALARSRPFCLVLEVFSNDCQAAFGATFRQPRRKALGGTMQPGETVPIPTGKEPS
jgi:hypothetical protein